MLGTIQSIIISAFSKSRVKPYPTSAYHPYRKTERAGHKVTADNIDTLKMIGDAIVAGRR